MDEWSSSLGHALVYGFLEIQSIHNAKDRRAKCKHYIETWIKESQQEVYLGAYLNQWVKFMQMIVGEISAQYEPNYCLIQGPLAAGCSMSYECIVFWFYSLHKKPDIHIKATINKLRFIL